MALVNLMRRCACGEVSEPFNASERGWPVGWLGGRLYFDGVWRHFSACSADCVAAAKKQVKEHYQDRLRGFFERIDSLRLKRE